MNRDLEGRKERKVCSTPAPGGDPLTPAEGGWSGSPTQCIALGGPATCFFRVSSLLSAKVFGLRPRAVLWPPCLRSEYSCETKPNFGGPGVFGVRRVEGDLSCKANPISGDRPERASAVQTKPIHSAPTGTVGGRQGRRWSATGDNRAKQTQFLPFCRSGDRRSREGRACETNPISGGRDTAPFQHSTIPVF